MFFDTYKQYCTKVGKSPNGVAKEMGFPSSSVTQWKKGSTPRPAALRKIADYFNVSVDVFLIKEEQKKEPAANVSDKLPSDFYLLSEAEQKQVTDYISFLLSQRSSD